jgi:hypothetical protein
MCVLYLNNFNFTSWKKMYKNFLEILGIFDFDFGFIPCCTNMKQTGILSDTKFLVPCKLDECFRSKTYGKIRSLSYTFMLAHLARKKWQTICITYVWNKGPLECDSLKISPSVMEWDVGPDKAVTKTPVAYTVHVQSPGRVHPVHFCYLNFHPYIVRPNAALCNQKLTVDRNVNFGEERVQCHLRVQEQKPSSTGQSVCGRELCWNENC